MPIHFLDEHTLVVSFLTREARATVGLSSRNKDPGIGAMQLHVLIIDTSDGSIRDSKSLAAGTRLSGVVATHNENIVIQRGSEVTLLSPENGPSHDRSLSLPSLHDGEWHAVPSVTGGSILFVATDLTTANRVRWLWVDSDTLTLLHTWEDVQSGWVTISDDTIAMVTCIWRYDCEPQLEKRGVGDTWVP